MKHCPICKENKHNEHFYTNKARYDNMDVYCITCIKDKQKQKQIRTTQRILEEQYIKGEIWKDITEFDGYEASTEGRIRNKKTCNLLTQSVNESGYGVSSIRNKNIKFHRIIAQTFLPNFENKTTVEHKDDNKLNNRVYNLKWATCKEQAQYVKEKNSRKYQKGVAKIIEQDNDLEEEIWKRISDFPEYSVSSMGRIKYPIRKGVAPYKERITFGGKSSDGYKTFKFINNDNTVCMAVHRIVAKEFINNPDGENIVNHKDGNKTNNCVTNLEWCSKSHNTKHAYDNGLISGKRKIYQLDVNNKLIKEWDSIQDAFTELKLGRTNINRVLSGKSKTAGGYYWCYKEEYDNTVKQHTKYDTNKVRIRQLDKKTKECIKNWESVSDAATYITRGTDYSIKAVKGNISSCIRKKRCSAYGFGWEYDNEE